MGWGKLLLVFATLAWVVHGVIGALLVVGTIAQFSPLFAAAATLTALAIAHQVIDPSVIGRRKP